LFKELKGIPANESFYAIPIWKAIKLFDWPFSTSRLCDILIGPIWSISFLLCNYLNKKLDIKKKLYTFIVWTYLVLYPGLLYAILGELLSGLTVVIGLSFIFYVLSGTWFFVKFLYENLVPWLKGEDL
jgi:hypothetical protein